MTSQFRSGSLGDVGMSGTFEDFTGDATYIGDLNDVVITMKGTADLDATAAMTLEYSQDGTRWASTPASSACTYAAPSASFVPTGRVQFVRALVSACAVGSFACRYTGRQTDQLYPKFGTLGDVSGTGAKAAVDVSELDHIIVTSSGGSGNTTLVQTSYDGTDWVTVGTLATTTNSLLVPLPAKLLRVNCSVYNAAEYLRFGGHKAPGKQRFGTLGDFSDATTGTAVAVDDLSKIQLNVVYTDSGTFTAAMTILIEGSSDGTSWAIVPSGTISATGTLDITAPYKLLRARCSAYTVGSATVRFGGVNTNLDG